MASEDQATILKAKGSKRNGTSEALLMEEPIPRKIRRKEPPVVSPVNDPPEEPPVVPSVNNRDGRHEEPTARGEPTAREEPQIKDRVVERVKYSVPLPLTWTAFPKRLNMQEDECVANRAWKYLHELLQNAFPHLRKVSGPGLVLAQMNKKEWEYDLWEGMYYLVTQRNKLVHHGWGYALRDPKKYRAVMKFVFGKLAPNVEFIHHNPGEKRMIEECNRLKAEMARILKKRRRDDREDYGY
jgi:hypothetical protein